MVGNLLLTFHVAIAPVYTCLVLSWHGLWTKTAACRYLQGELLPPPPNPSLLSWTPEALVLPGWGGSVFTLSSQLLLLALLVHHSWMWEIKTVHSILRDVSFVCYFPWKCLPRVPLCHFQLLSSHLGAEAPVSPQVHGLALCTVNRREIKFIPALPSSISDFYSFSVLTACLYFVSLADVLISYSKVVYRIYI